MVIFFLSDDDSYFDSLIEYCKLERIPFKKVSLEECFVKYVDVSKKDFCLVDKDDFDIVFSKIEFFFYRSGKLNHIDSFDHQSVSLLSDVERTYLHLEVDTLLDFIYSLINEKSFGYLAQKPLNKLVQLHIANKHQIGIPKTLVSNSKEKVVETLGSSFITKAIQENIAFQDSTQLVYQRVEKITSDELNDEFFPSLFQEGVEKIIELRCFYFDQKFYSIAFSSEHGQLDMRDNYDNMDYYKYQLPCIIEEKLRNVFNDLKLFSGSVDMLIDKNGNYIFLEINPEGQFDWVSKLGGYDLNRIITDYLKSIR